MSIDRDARGVTGLTEEGVGVVSAPSGLGALLEWIRPTFELAGSARPVLDIGYFANVIPVGPRLGIAISTDGVGTKLLVAQAAGRYDTVGVDCVAMNVNDLICVGARPVALVDYVAVEEASPELLGPLGEGLAAGCRDAGVSCPGGELAQVREMLRGPRPGTAFDLVGTAIGTVELDRVLDGGSVRAGDVLLGIHSSGLHSNGFTLARRALLERGKLALESHVPELGCVLAEELLRPTRIYVKPVLRVLDAGLPVHAVLHVTGDGLFNMTRIKSRVGFDVEHWPEVPAIFRLIQRLGDVPDEEMFRAFNMGVGMVLVLGADGADAARSIIERSGMPISVLGKVVDADEPSLHLRPQGLLGRRGAFRRL